MAQFYNTPNALLKHIRFLFIKLDGYSGFLRIEKIIGVRVKDISFVDKEYMSTFIQKKEEKRKKNDDQHREGHTSPIALTCSLSCPVNITQRLLSLLPGDKDSSFSFVRRIVVCKKSYYFHPSLGISYSTARDLFKEHFTPFVDVPSRFSTGWKNRLSKRHYIKCSTSDL